MIVHSREKLKDHILSKYNQFDILSIYLGIPVSTLEQAVITNKPIHNPLRNDNNPSLAILQSVDKEGWTKIRIYDRAVSEFRGDIFDLVGISIGRNPSNPYDFIMICNEIISSCRTNEPNSIYFNTKTKNKKLVKTSKETKIFDIWVRKWTADDKRFWSRYGLDIEYLESNYVYPISRLVIDTTATYVYNRQDPAFAYWFGKQKNIDLYKVYFPRRKKNDKRGRFQTNSRFLIEGLHFLHKADNLILTKSRKDALVIKKILKTLDQDNRFCVSNLSGESIILPEYMINKLLDTYENIFINVDFDKGGINTAISYRRKYNLPVIMLTDGKFGSVDYKTKDISDYVKKFGYIEAVKLVQHAINYYLDNN
jgi:hypothetical protein